MLNRLSRRRSDVGRTDMVDGPFNDRPRNSPPTMRKDQPSARRAGPTGTAAAGLAARSAATRLAAPRGRPPKPPAPLPPDRRCGRRHARPGPWRRRPGIRQRFAASALVTAALEAAAAARPRIGCAVASGGTVAKILTWRPVAKVLARGAITTFAARGPVAEILPRGPIPKVPRTSRALPALTARRPIAEVLARRAITALTARRPVAEILARGPVAKVARTSRTLPELLTRRPVAEVPAWRALPPHGAEACLRNPCEEVCPEIARARRTLPKLLARRPIAKVLASRAFPALAARGSITVRLARGRSAPSSARRHPPRFFATRLCGLPAIALARKRRALRDPMRASSRAPPDTRSTGTLRPRRSAVSLRSILRRPSPCSAFSARMTETCLRVCTTSRAESGRSFGFSSRSSRRPPPDGRR